jgi:hypothetical protein
MKENSSMEAHLKEMKGLTEKLAAIESPISEEDQVVTLLGSLPDSYQNIVTALEARTDDLTLSYVQQTLLYEEKKRSGASIVVGNGGSALAAKGRGKVQGKKKFKCYLCGAIGHFKKDCPQNKKNPSSSPSPSHKAKIAAENGVENVTSNELELNLFKAAVGKSDLSSDWLIDRGSSCHMTRQKDLLSQYLHFEKPQKVSLGDGFTEDAVGRGQVMVKMLQVDGASQESMLTEVLYVPDLRCNLFSVRAAVSKGKTVEFSGK